MQKVDGGERSVKLFDELHRKGNELIHVTGSSPTRLLRCGWSYRQDGASQTLHGTREGFNRQLARYFSDSDFRRDAWFRQIERYWEIVRALGRTRASLWFSGGFYRPRWGLFVHFLAGNGRDEAAGGSCSCAWIVSQKISAGAACPVRKDKLVNGDKMVAEGGASRWPLAGDALSSMQERRRQRRLQRFEKKSEMVPASLPTGPSIWVIRIKHIYNFWCSMLVFTPFA
jgi:hypothetical protein